MTLLAGRPGREAVLLTAAGAGALGVLSVLFVADPATTPIFPPCPWRALTGWLCPGCGSARAMHALVHGHLDVAWRLNAFAVAAVPFVAVDIASRLRGDGRALTSRLQPVYVRAIAVAIVAFGIFRNVFSST